MTKRFLVLAILLFAAGCAQWAPLTGRTAVETPPSLAYPDLFKRVAMTELYEPKDWADMRPLRSVKKIERDYERLAPMSDDDLARFVAANFAQPRVVGEGAGVASGLTLMQHIAALWPVLTRPPEPATGRGSLLPLPHPYIVPGGRFREAYYWDAYFTMLGLDGSAARLRKDMVDNFAAEIKRYGHIPNGNRSYYLSRSQPPFFYLMVGLLDEKDPASAWAQYVKTLQAEHRFWTADAAGLAPGEARGRSVAMPGGSILQRYDDDRAAPRDESFRYDVATAKQSTRPPDEVYRDLRAAAESGWDFSSRWLAEGGGLASIETTDIVPVDLNALLYGLERAIAAGCARLGEERCRDQYETLAAARKASVERYLWSDDGYYADYDLADGASRAKPTAAMLYPLFTGLAAPERAASTLDAAEKRLLAKGGVLPTPVSSGEQWDAPNGWAPHQWIAIRAAETYGRMDLARDIAERWLKTVSRGYCESGKLVEKYDVVTHREGGGGEYPNQDGFGWTNGVAARLMKREPDLAAYGETVPHSDPSQCR